MSVKTRSYYLIISIISFFLLLFFYFFPLTPSLPSISSLPITNNSKYTVKPIFPYQIWENSELYLPLVQISPNDKKYWIVQLREKFDLMMGNFDELFFAEKRIAELASWGKILNQTQWEANLNMYDKSMQRYLHTKLSNLTEDQRYDAAISLYQELNSHESTLKASVVNGLFPIDTQTILNDKISNIIDPLKLILVDNQENDDIKYSLAPIIKDKKFGIYLTDDNQVIEITPDNPEKTYTLKYPLKTQEFKFSTTLESDPINLLNKYLFRTNTVLKPGTTYLTRISFFSKHPFNMVLNQKINATESAQLINQALYPDKKESTTTIVFTTPERKKPLIYWPNIMIESKYPIPWSRLDSFDITIRPVFNKELTLTKINTATDYQPQIKISRVGQNQYRIYYKNTTQTQDNLIKASFGFIWEIHEDSENSFTVSIRFLTLLAYISMFSFFIFVFYGLVKILFYKILNVIFKIFQFFRFPSLIISLFLICLDIFFISKPNDMFILLVLFFWTISIIGFQATARISFLFALVYLVMCPVLILLQKEVATEKLAIWAYTMLVAGTVQSIIEIKLNLENLRSPWQVFKIILKNPLTMVVVSILLSLKLILTKIKQGLVILIVKILRSVYQLIIKILRIVYRLFDYIINFNPATIFELISTVVKTLIFMILIVYFGGIMVYFGNILFKKGYSVYIAYKVEYHKQALIEERKKLLMSRQPKIDLMEPTLVYKATKIVIYGDHYGWNKDSNTKVILDDTTIVRTLLWTDSKIVFIVPLEWKSGNHSIHIEKTIDWDGKKIKVKSVNKVFQILSITDTTNKNDDLYFEQMKLWRKETLQLNGYN